MSAANTHRAEWQEADKEPLTMTATIFDSARSVKTVRPFGTLPARERRMPYTWQDLASAAQMFADAEADRELETRALEAEWDDRFNGSIPATGHCLNCGDRCDDLTTQGLCDRCDTLATEATTAGQNGRAGLGYRVF
jgi:hypothetical protein